MKTPFHNTHPECPSELALDQLTAGELEGGADRPLRTHIESCGRCQARMSIRERGFGAFPNLDVAKMTSKISSQVVTQTGSAGGAEVIPLSRYLRIAVPLALAASVAVAVLFAPQAPRDEDTLKGSLHLRVYRERDGNVSEVTSGDRFRAGDRLRFKSSPQTDGEIMIVGSESGAKLFVYYPGDGSKSSTAPKLQDDGALPGAVELDEHQGEEWLHLVWCPRHFSVTELTAGDAAKNLSSPSGCKLASFMLDKE